MRWRDIDYDLSAAAPLLFIVLILIPSFVMLYHYRKNKLAQLAAPRILSVIEEPRKAILFWIKSFLFCTAWICGVLALMQPKGNGRYPVPSSEHDAQHAAQPHQARQIAQDVIFLLDASASMGVSDTRSGNQRLDESKDVIEQVVSHLKGQEAALYAFTSTTMQLVPLTTDYLFFRLMLRQLAINEGETAGTDIEQALKAMNEKLLTIPKHKQVSLVILTDGGDTRLEGLQGSQRDAYIQKMIHAIAGTKIENAKFYVVGLGSLQGKEIPDITFQEKPVVSALNGPLLQQLNHALEGQLLLAKDWTTLHIADTILEGLKRDQQFEEGSVNSPRIESKQDELRYDLYFQIPLGVAILALFLALLLPETRSIKRHLIVVICGFLISNTGLLASSSEEDSSMQKAWLYFDANDFQRAADQYRNLLEASLLPWQRAIITYDLGTVFLAQDKEDEALATFQSIDPGTASFPLLKYRLQLNTALAHLLLAKKQSDIVLKNTSATIEDYRSSLTLLEQTMSEVSQAETAWCQLLKAEKAITCEPSVEANDMRIEGQHLLNTMQQGLHHILLSQATLQTGSVVLLIGSKAALRHVDFMMTHPMNVELAKEYIELFQKQEKSWFPLWDALKLLAQGRPDKEMQDLFQQAAEKFSEGVISLAHEKYDISKQAFQASISALQSFAKRIFDDSTIEEQLQMLLTQYTLLLMEKPMKEMSLSSLIELQTLLEKPLKKIEREDKEAEYEHAQQALGSASFMMQQGQLAVAKIYAEEANYQIKRLLWGLQQKGKQIPEQILTHLIEDQEHALLLNRLRLDLKGKEEGNPRLDQLIAKAQSRTLQLADAFYPTVLMQQKEQFSSSASSQPPWEEIIPLFFKGMHSGKEAERLLLSSIKQDEYDAVNFQNETIVTWKTVLMHIHKKKESDIKQKMDMPLQQKPAQSEKAKFNQNESTEESGGSSFNDLLRSLQEMENDDHSQPYFKETSIDKEVERPW